METPEEGAAARAQPAGAAAPAPHALPTNRFAHAIERAVLRVGRGASWLWAVLIAVVVVNVAARYGFGRGSIMLEEVQWHLYAVGFLLAFSYATVADRHVRVDVLSERLAPRTRGWIELLGLVLFLLPFALVVALYAAPFVATSFRLAEVSVAPGGLPYRFVLKAFIVLGFALLAAAAMARASRCCTLLFGWPRALPSSAGH